MKKSIALLISFLMVLTLLPAVAWAADVVSNWSEVVDSNETEITLSNDVTITGGNYNLAGKTVTFSGTATISGDVTITNGTILRGAGNIGALFEVDSGRSLTLEKVIVDGANISTVSPLIDAGGQWDEGGSIVLNAGTILQNNICTSAGEGGAITLGEDAKLEINGAVICNNKNENENAGAIKAYAGAKITMNSGEIYGNEAAAHGGAIQIFGNNSTDNEYAVFTMYGGTIRDNKAGGVGGGVAVSNFSKFIMNGGEIKNNSTTDGSKRGGGVGFGDSDTSMQISGSATITGNTAGSDANNLYIGGTYYNNQLEITGPLSGTIGITRPSNKTGDVFTSITSRVTPSTYIIQFSSDKDKYYVADNGSGQLLLKEATNTIIFITNLEENGTANPGETLSVSASAGDAAISYQWYSCTDEDKSGASAISGATNPSFTVPTDLSAGDHYYFCRVRADGANPVDSNVVRVSKAATYTVTYTDGVGGAVFANQVYYNLTAGTLTPAFNGTPSRSGFTFTGWSPSVAATVTYDATYTAQWRKNGTTAGSDSSNSPAITSPTTDQEVFVYVNSNATMSIDAKDAKTYQWYVDRGNGFEAISGATGASYTTSKVELKNDGYRYYCVATNAYGTDISPIFTLNVTKDIVTPKTGDNAQNGLWTGLIMIAAAGLCACTVVWRKRSQA